MVKVDFFRRERVLYLQARRRRRRRGRPDTELGRARRQQRAARRRLPPKVGTPSSLSLQYFISHEISSNFPENGKSTKKIFLRFISIARMIEVTFLGFEEDLSGTGFECSEQRGFGGREEGDDESEEGERGDGSHPPIQRSKHQKLHPPNRLSVEYASFLSLRNPNETVKLIILARICMLKKKSFFFPPLFFLF